jgi:cytochrome P450
MDVDLSLRPGEGLPLDRMAGIRARGAVFRSDALAGWAVTTYDDVKRVLSDRARFASEGTPIAAAFGPEAMLVTDTLLHNRMRGVWAQSVSVAAMAARAAQIRGIAQRRIAPAVARLEGGESVDLVGVFQDFTAEAITWMTAIDRARIGDIQRWNRLMSDTPALGEPQDSPTYRQHFAARAEVYEFLRAKMRLRRERPAAGAAPEDLIAQIVAAEGRDGITEQIAADNLMNLVLGALDTTAKWLGNIIVTLAHQPDALAEIRADRRLLPQAIEEVMRTETVGQILMRRVREDATPLAGQILAANDLVYVLPGIANRDPAAFDDADRFDIHRTPKLHLGFGFGMHQCLGLNIARQEAVSFIDVLLDRVAQFEIADCDYSPGWAFWGPVKLELRLPGGSA